MYGFFKFSSSSEASKVKSFLINRLEQTLVIVMIIAITAAIGSLAYHSLNQIPDGIQVNDRTTPLSRVGNRWEVSKSDDSAIINTEMFYYGIGEEEVLKRRASGEFPQRRLHKLPSGQMFVMFDIPSFPEVRRIVVLSKDGSVIGSRNTY